MSETNLLPDFNKPPIDGLRLGVTFDQTPNLEVKDLYDLSGLFKAQFPITKVEKPSQFMISPEAQENQKLH